MSVDFSFITERIATGGGIQSVDDITALVAAGISHVIDMRAEYNDNLLADKRIDYLWLPQNDDGTRRDPQQVIEGIAYALEVLRDGLRLKVFCHCAAGVNRGPLETYAILRGFGIPQQEAIDRIRAKRPVVAFFNQPNYINSVEDALK